MSTEPMMLLCWRNKEKIATRFLQANVCISVHHCGGGVAHGVQLVELATSLVTQVVNDLAATENVGPATWRDCVRTVAQSCFPARKHSLASKLVTNHSKTFPPLTHHSAVTPAETGKKRETVFLLNKTGKTTPTDGLLNIYCLSTPNCVAAYHLWPSSLRLLTLAILKWDKTWWCNFIRHFEVVT